MSDQIRRSRPRASGGHPPPSWAYAQHRRRPRASGGHPPTPSLIKVVKASSPRERGSSPGPLQAGHRLLVVPARAGVIPDGYEQSLDLDRRPRASGGHPIIEARDGMVVESSPRERGSSPLRLVHLQRRGVVPARAGVIRPPPATPSPPPSRPRASGGHPLAAASRAVCRESSPRERGSSCSRGPLGRVGLVVPARAGVIPQGSWLCRGLPGRPRASGGHPPVGEVVQVSPWSSPRERGSSSSTGSSGSRRSVVPARAGVIRR